MPPWLSLLIGSICALCAIASTVLTVMQGRRLRRIEGKGNEACEIARRHSNMFKRFLDENGHGDNFTKTQVLREDEIKWVK